MAFDEIDPAAPLIIANSDQVIDVDLAAIVDDFRHRGLDAGVITFDSIHPRWSYVRLEGDAIVEAHEKKVISRHAIAGFYYFARGADFIAAAEQAILNGAEVDGAYYISAALNEMILAGKAVGSHQIPAAAYHSFYSPEKIAEYVRIAQSAATEDAARASAKGAVTVVIPMAGLGSRFAEAGYDKPKPFIDVAGRMMIERVIDNLAMPGAGYVLLARDSHLEAEPATAATLASRGDVSFLSVKALTEGAACTVLLARAQIDNDRPLLIANCDQIVDFDCAAFVDDCLARGLDGSILVFRDAERDPKWSFARTDAAGLVEEVKEKQPISDLATVGLYFFRRGADFVAAATDMIVRNDRSKNEFYVAPAYNYAIAAGKRIGVYEVDAGAMHGIGTPADLDAYLARLGA